MGADRASADAWSSFKAVASWQEADTLGFALSGGTAAPWARCSSPSGVGWLLRVEAHYYEAIAHGR